MNTKLYAIVFSKTGEILSPDSFREYWPNYGSNSLYGWRKPKKIYLTLGTAKSGFSHVPKELAEHLSIAEFSFSKEIANGSEVAEQQEKKRILAQEKRIKNRAKYELKQAQEDLIRARNKLKNLQK